MNFYSTAAASFTDPEAPHHAELFATRATIALRHVKHEEHLTEAMRSRQLVGQAIGIMGERYKITEERAFHYLARVSAAGQRKVRDVAKEVVDPANRRAILASAAD